MLRKEYDTRQTVIFACLQAQKNTLNFSTLYYICKMIQIDSQDLVMLT